MTFKIFEATRFPLFTVQDSQRRIVKEKGKTLLLNPFSPSFIRFFTVSYGFTMYSTYVIIYKKDY